MRYLYAFAMAGLLAVSCAKESDVVNMLPDIKTGDFVTTSRTTATLEGSVALNDASAESMGIVYADDPNMMVNPQVLTVDLSNGASGRAFSVDVTGLSAGRTYYYRAFVHSSNQYYYGDYRMFTTPQMSAPTFEAFTVSAEDVSASEMQLKAKIRDLGVESNSGVALTNTCFKYRVLADSAQVASLVFSDSDKEWQTIQASYDADKKSLTATLTGLHSSTCYAICAYATTAGYGISNLVAVTTEATAAPEVSEAVIMHSESLANAVRLRASVLNPGTSPVTERGFVYSSVTEIPLYEGSNAVVANDDFVAEIPNLASATKYYIRAYARNENGIGYGAVIEYVTPDVVITPTILTVAANDVKSSSATLVGYLKDNGLEVSEVGFVINGNRVPVQQNGNGTYYLELSNLSSSTQYTYHAYCILSSGDTFEGEERSFTTKNAPADEEIEYPAIGS